MHAQRGQNLYYNALEIQAPKYTGIFFIKFYQIQSLEQKEKWNKEIF